MGNQSTKDFEQLSNIDETRYIDKLFSIKYSYAIENDKSITLLLSYLNTKIEGEHYFSIDDEEYKSYMGSPIAKIISDESTYLMYKDKYRSIHFIIEIICNGNNSNKIVQTWHKNNKKLLTEIKYNGKNSREVRKNLWDNIYKDNSCAYLRYEDDKGFRYILLGCINDNDEIYSPYDD